MQSSPRDIFSPLPPSSVYYSFSLDQIQRSTSILFSCCLTIASTNFSRHPVRRTGEQQKISSRPKHHLYYQHLTNLMNMNIDCLQLIEKTTGMLWKVTQFWLIYQLVKIVVVYESHVRVEFIGSIQNWCWKMQLLDIGIGFTG